jgi:hypothetical protein
VDEAKAFQLSKYFKKGFYLDVKDDFNWCVAMIQEHNADKSFLSIHFDNWSNKYDEVRRSEFANF